MKLIIPVLLLTLFLIPQESEARSSERTPTKRQLRPEHSMSIEEIDRPITLPSRHSEISIGYGVKWMWEALKHMPSEPRFYHSPTSQGYKYGINDRVQLNFNLLPSIEISLTDNYVVEDGVVSNNGNSFSLEFGLTSFMFNDSNKIDLVYVVALHSKIPVRENVWFSPDLEITSRAFKSIGVHTSFSTGFQLTPKIAVEPLYRIEQLIATGRHEMYNRNMDKYQVTHVLGAIIHLNLTDHFCWNIYMDTGLISYDNTFDGGAMIQSLFVFNW